MALEMRRTRPIVRVRRLAPILLILTGLVLAPLTGTLTSSGYPNRINAVEAAPRVVQGSATGSRDLAGPRTPADASSAETPASCPASTGRPVVSCTLVLFNNTIVPGNFLAGNGNTGSLAYDSATGQIFDVSDVTTVISDVTNSVVATIPVSGSSVAYDSAKGEVFISSGDNISVISDTTDSVVATVPVPGGANALAYDIGKGEIFVVSAGDVDVISDTTNSLVATIAVTAGLGDIVYDGGKGEVFVTGPSFCYRCASGYVYAISDSTDLVVANITVGNDPEVLTYDPAQGEIYVACNGFEAPVEVDVISDTTNDITADLNNLYLGGIAYDGARGEIVGTNYYTGNVTFLAAATNVVVATVPTGVALVGDTYDSGKGEIFVSNSQEACGGRTCGRGSVDVISDTTDTLVATIPTGSSPVVVAFDSERGEMFVADNSANLLDVISAATGSILATVPLVYPPLGLVYDSARGEVFVADGGNVAVVSDVTNSVVANVPVGGSPIGLSYDSGKGEIFAANEGSNVVDVISDSTDKVVTYITIEIGLQSVYPLGVAYDSGKGETFVSDVGYNSAAGNVTVISDSTNAIVATIPVGPDPDGVVYDRARGEVFVVNDGLLPGQNQSADSVSVISDSTNSVIATVPLDAAVGPYIPEDLPQISAPVYDANLGEIFVPNAGSGNVSVISDATNSVVASVPVGGVPVCGALDSSTGLVWVVNDGQGTISLLSQAGGPRTGSPGGGATSWLPIALVALGLAALAVVVVLARRRQGPATPGGRTGTPSEGSVPPSRPPHPADDVGR
jgi:YVTN family beta-propeller protein